MKRIVLVRPSGPRNVGMIVRIAANFGPCEIVLVAPERPALLLHPDFEQMSHGVTGASKKCRILPSLEAALADATHSIGFTARTRDRRPRADWRQLREEILGRAHDTTELVALVFGNETTGFTKQEALQCADLAHIATAADHTSLNLAIAVGVVMSGLFVEKGFRKREKNRKALSGQGREFLAASMKRVFADTVARTPAARRDILAMIDRHIARAPLEDRDARAWHLLLRALGNDITPKALGIRLHERRGRRMGALKHTNDCEHG